MSRVWILLPLLLLLSAPAAQSQGGFGDFGACAELRVHGLAPTSDQWVSSSGRGADYRLDFTADADCAATRASVPCADGSTIQFSNGPLPVGVKVRITPNSVPARATDTPTGSTSLNVTASAEAAHFTSHHIQVYAFCAGTSAASLVQIIVDEPFSADAFVVSGDIDRDTIRWGLELVGKGGGGSYTTLDFQPSPTEAGGVALKWNVPSSVDLAQNSSSRFSLKQRQFLNVTVENRDPDLPYRITMNPSFNFIPGTNGTPIVLELPTYSFDSKPSPSGGSLATTLVAAIVGTFVRRANRR